MHPKAFLGLHQGVCVLYYLDHLCLMQIICEGTVAQDARVREASFECLVKIAANYYEKLPAYMQQIFSLTHHAALEDEEDVAKQAIEFWCTVCEEEIDIQQVMPLGS